MPQMITSIAAGIDHQSREEAVKTIQEQIDRHLKEMEPISTRLTIVSGFLQFVVMTILFVILTGCDWLRSAIISFILVYFVGLFSLLSVAHNIHPKASLLSDFAGFGMADVWAACASLAGALVGAWVGGQWRLPGAMDPKPISNSPL